MRKIIFDVSKCMSQEAKKFLAQGLDKIANRLILLRSFTFIFIQIDPPLFEVLEYVFQTQFM